MEKEEGEEELAKKIGQFSTGLRATKVAALPSHIALNTFREYPVEPRELYCFFLFILFSKRKQLYIYISIYTCI